MKQKPIQMTSYIYLLIVPFLSAAVGFGFGHVSYKIYLPIWILNIILMIVSSWFLGLNVIRLNNQENTYLAKAVFLIIAP